MSSALSQFDGTTKAVHHGFNLRAFSDRVLPPFILIIHSKGNGNWERGKMAQDEKGFE